MEEPDLPLYQDPHFWVAIGFVVFFVLFGKKLFTFLIGVLDSRAGRIRAELEEAQRLRQEAEEALAAYRRKYDAAAREAEDILAHAREEAEMFARQTQAGMKTLLETRTRMAQEKIGQAEKQAIEEIRQHVADITIAAARALITENLANIPQDAPLRAAIADLEGKVH